MITMYDAAAGPASIPVSPGPGKAVLYPIDGIFAGNWPATAVEQWSESCPYSNLADEALDLPVLFYDVENGNAAIGQVITALKARQAAGLRSGIYCNDSTHSQTVVPAMSAAALSFTAGASWPAPGIYLGLAEPTQVEHVTPPSVFTQYLWGGSYDASACVGTFPSLVPATSPPPPPGPAPAPIPTPQPLPPGGKKMLPCAVVSDGNEGGQAYVIWPDRTLTPIASEQAGAAWLAMCGQSGFEVMDGADIANIAKPATIPATG